MRALEGLKLERDDGEKRPKNPAQRKLRTTRTGSAASKVRLLTFDALDGRSVAAKYAQETRAAIEADLGGPDRLSTLERLQVENAALDAAVLRDLQIKWLKGEDINIGDLIAIENVFNRTAAALGTTRRPKEVLDIDTYLQRGQMMRDDEPFLPGTPEIIDFDDPELLEPEPPAPRLPLQLNP